MEQNQDKIKQKNENEIKGWYSMLKQNETFLPSIDPKDFDNAVNLLVGVGLKKIYDIFNKEVKNEKIEHIYIDLQIKAMNTLLKTKKVLLEEEEFKERKAQKEIKIPSELRVGKQKEDGQ